jgi:hypothetical protein
MSPLHLAACGLHEDALMALLGAGAVVGPLGHQPSFSPRIFGLKLSSTHKRKEKKI